MILGGESTECSVYKVGLIVPTARSWYRDFSKTVICCSGSLQVLCKNAVKPHLLYCMIDRLNGTPAAGGSAPSLAELTSPCVDGELTTARRPGSPEAIGQFQYNSQRFSLNGHFEYTAKCLSLIGHFMYTLGACH